MRQSRQLRIALLVVLAVVGLGLVFALSPWGGRGLDVGPPASKDEAPPQTQDQTAFDQLFKDGVEHLRLGRAHEALVVLDAARRIRPHVPEIFVNLGFAHLDSGHYRESGEAFRKAIELHPMQDNAYYGLALSFEKLGDFEAALGAMRTFVHLTARDTIHFRRAQAAIREFEIRLGRADRPLIPENESGTMSQPPKSKLGIEHSP